MNIADFWVEEISSSHEVSRALHHTNRSPGHTYRWASKSTSIADIVNIFVIKVLVPKNILLIEVLRINF